MTALLAIAFPLCCLLALKLALRSMRKEWAAAASVVSRVREDTRPIHVRRTATLVSRDRVASGPWAPRALGC
jgi:hypothetical protein